MNGICSAIFVVSCWGTIPSETVVDDSVDVIEVNHFFDENGEHKFDQLIFYDWSYDDNRFHVRAWRMLEHVDQQPQRDWATGRYVVIFYDEGVLRHVRSASLRHSWTQFDPELVERQLLPAHQRRELSNLARRAKQQVR